MSTPSVAARLSAVELRDLQVTLGGTRIISGLDAAVGVGEVVAIIGTNGSGKSTLVRAIAGLLPYRGRVLLFGAPAGRRERRRIGYVPQRTSVAAGIPATAREVVASGLVTGLLRPGAGPRSAAVATALETVQLAERADRPVTELSGGQQQRLLIARALVRDPDLLILDEPMAGVDLQQQAAFADTLADLRRQGRTIVLVLHEFGALAGLIDRVIALRDGSVVYDGPATDEYARCADEVGVHLDLPGYTGHDHVHAHGDPHPTTRPIVEQPLSGTAAEVG